MPPKDLFHGAVKNALIKEGWTITHNPLFIRFGDIDLYIDLGAEKVIAAEKDGRKIAVEIKSFLGTSVINRNIAFYYSLVHIASTDGANDRY